MLTLKGLKKYPFLNHKDRMNGTDTSAAFYEFDAERLGKHISVLHNNKGHLILEDAQKAPDPEIKKRRMDSVGRFLSFWA